MANGHPSNLGGPLTFLSQLLQRVDRLCVCCVCLVCVCVGGGERGCREGGNPLKLNLSLISDLTCIFLFRSPT